tara:strand:+ start:1297 stop:1665 length:369 start_codon:yes stop_codon:yes gene_type:complete
VIALSLSLAAALSLPMWYEGRSLVCVVGVLFANPARTSEGYYTPRFNPPPPPYLGPVQPSQNRSAHQFSDARALREFLVEAEVAIGKWEDGEIDALHEELANNWTELRTLPVQRCAQLVPIS